MGKFSYSERGISFNQYSDEHVGIDLHAQKDRGTGVEVEATVAHHPQTAEDAERQCHEFYSVSLTSRQETCKSSGDFSLRGHTNDSVTAYLDRDAILALHAALGEIIEQSEGLSRGAASGRAVVKASDFAEASDAE